jgi:hypothetical protein
MAQKIREESNFAPLGLSSPVYATSRGFTPACNLFALLGLLSPPLPLFLPRPGLGPPLTPHPGLRPPLPLEGRGVPYGLCPFSYRGGERLRVPTAVATPLPSRGGVPEGRGGVCNFYSAACKARTITLPRARQEQLLCRVQGKNNYSAACKARTSPVRRRTVKPSTLSSRGYDRREHPRTAAGGG